MPSSTDPTGAAASSPTYSTAYLRYALGLLTVVYVVNFVDRQILAILLQSIKDEFGLSDFQLGVLPKAEKLSGDGASIAAGGSVTVDVKTTDGYDQATPFTTIHFFPDPGGSAVCPSPASLPTGAR